MYCCDTANNVYAVKVDTSAQYTNIIFSNAGSAQTDDLAMGQIGYMYDLSMVHGQNIVQMMLKHLKFLHLVHQQPLQVK